MLNTRVFIFILTSGIFQSQWCLEELKSAITNNKKIIIIRELSFALPQVLPDAWKDSLGALLERGQELIWMAEYNSSCIQELMYIIGPSDENREKAKELIEANPEIITELQENHILKTEINEFPLYVATECDFKPNIEVAQFRYPAAPSAMEFKYFFTKCRHLEMNMSIILNIPKG